MIEERAIRRYEDEFAEYERELEQFRALAKDYEREREKNPESEALKAKYADLQDRQKRLKDWFERLNAKREIIA